MKSAFKFAHPVLLALGLGLHTSAGLAAPTPGPLRSNPANPRYFTDGTGKPVYLTGAHTWNNLQDMGPSNPPPAFDFERYLDFLEQHHHNFIRLWRWELLRLDTAVAGDKNPHVNFVSPHPWVRSGPGLALDGQPKFDLSRFDEAYFTRLRERVRAASQRGVYVAIMLFEGWGMQFVPDAWKAHPFHPANHVNGLPNDSKAEGLTIYTLGAPEVTALQGAYVRQVIDTVNDLDNVLYEISNENHPPSTQWQEHWIRFIHQYERTKPKQHPVGMTFQYKGGSNATLFNSPADWISPNPAAESGYDYQKNPPPADGRKVILNDTDHLWGIGGDVPWVWKSFLRGHNPLFMDPYDGTVLSGGPEEQWKPIRQALGQTRRLAERVNLNAMRPMPELASSKYCLADAGREYLVFQPDQGELTVDLSGADGLYNVVWSDPVTGKQNEGQAVQGGAPRSFQAPYRPAVLRVWKAIAPITQ